MSCSQAALATTSVVLVFVPSPSLRLARAALGAGAGGLLHGGMSPGQILRAVRVALRGETVLPRGLLAEWVAEQRTPDLGAVLSARQREILELLAEGSTNAEIAGRLFLSESTVKQHLRAAYKALGVRNRREAAALSRRYTGLSDVGGIYPCTHLDESGFPRLTLAGGWPGGRRR